ncbi:MAG: HD domain-containing protein [Planctomycetes bacterium]|nr:HD domain-containing protein [Planctomycetota bacterium]
MLRQSRGLEDLAAAIVVPVRRVGLVTGFALVLLTGVVTRRVINRYENRVARLNEELEEKVRRRSAELLQTRDAVIFGLAKLADSRDQDTGEHLDRIQQLTCLLAEQLRGTHPEIDRAWIERLRLATPLHDIGKVGIPDSILLKPGPLTPAERRTMQRHAEIGAECLAAIGGRLGPNDFLAMARDIAQAHNERYDGAGYPRGLRGNAIPLAARIVALADVYDAATNKRVYKAPQSHAAVRGMILASRGKHFDPTIVDAFLAVEHCFKSNGQRGRVATAGSSGPLFTPRPASKRLVPTV